VTSATRPARRLYVGGVPTSCQDAQLAQFLNQTLIALGLCKIIGRNPILSCQLNMDRNFAFIEFFDVVDCTKALALDGIPYQGHPLKIRRPRDFQRPVGLVDPAPLGVAAITQRLAANAAMVAAAAGGVGGGGSGARQQQGYHHHDNHDGGGMTSLDDE